MQVDEIKLNQVVRILTGLTPVETNGDGKFTLSLGTKDPVEIGFYKKNHPNLSTKEMRYSAYVRLLGVVADLLKSPNEFDRWIKQQSK